MTVGSIVKVGIPGHPTYVGRVDAKTPDSGMVWVISGAGQGRQMLGRREGVRLKTSGGTP
ncbi:hypothetical protein C9424_16780 [Arthrobacter sp. H-02-3]|nr:hypothetical protein C9424_16780 [Arthrobacter sp. H-02-3]